MPQTEKEKTMAVEVKKDSVPKHILERIDNHAWAVAGVGSIAGLKGPGVDIPIIAGVWCKLGLVVAKECDVSLSTRKMRDIAFATATAVGLFFGAAKTATWLLPWAAALFTGGISLVAGAAANATLNYAITKAFGRACAHIFLHGDEIGSVEAIVASIVAIMAADMGWDMKGKGA
jgi:hypothetical protein